MIDEDENNNSLTAADVEQNTSNESMGAKKVKGFNSLVNIKITSYRKRKHDPDGPSIKFILDGLVQRQILVDDSTKEINEITYKSILSKDEKTIIEITDELK